MDSLECHELYSLNTAEPRINGIRLNPEIGDNHGLAVAPLADSARVLKLQKHEKRSHKMAVKTRNNI
jgi:hypothetical protein